MRPMTALQRRVLAYIKAHLKKNGYPPTRGEIAQHFEWDSLNSAQQHLQALQTKGKIIVTNGVSRGIKIRCAA